MRVFLGWLRGETRHCSMVAIPTIEEEDARRPNRERQNLVTEQTRIINQIKAIFTRFGIRSLRPTMRKLAEGLEDLRTAEGTPLPQNTLAELRRHLARLRFVRDQIRAVEQERLRKLAVARKKISLTNMSAVSTPTPRTRAIRPTIELANAVIVRCRIKRAFVRRFSLPRGILNKNASPLLVRSLNPNHAASAR
jgi:transposase